MTINKKTTKKPAAPRSSNDFPKAYMRLRTVLDALELNALQYCLEDENAATRKVRAAEIETWLMPVIERLTNKELAGGGVRGDCEEGYHNCGGVCVPYRCP